MTFTSTIIPSVSGKKSAWLKVGTLLDGLSPPLRNAHIVYNADKILYCGREDPPAHLIKKDNNKPDLVLANATLLPGLIDAHAHLFLEGGAMDFAARKAHLEKSSEELLEKALDRLARLLKCGIIAVRDARDKNGVGLALSRLSEMGNNPLLPYLNSPGAAIYHKGFYGSFMADPLVDHATLKGAVISRINGGSDRIKIIPTGIINFKKGAVTQKPQMTPYKLRPW